VAFLFFQISASQEAERHKTTGPRITRGFFYSLHKRKHLRKAARREKKRDKMYNLRITIWNVDDEEDTRSSTNPEAVVCTPSKKHKTPGLNTSPPDF
jgi:hypothetical protein